MCPAGLQVPWMISSALLREMKLDQSEIVVAFDIELLMSGLMLEVADVH